MDDDSKVPSLGRRFGALAIVGVLAFVAIFNTWASLDKLKQNTISAYVTLKKPVIAVCSPIFAGGVLGHWASRDQDLPAVPGGPLPLLGVVVALGLFDWLTHGALSRYPFWMWALQGLILGAALWPMAKVAS